jgi:hypothetical protein
LARFNWHFLQKKVKFYEKHDVFLSRIYNFFTHFDRVLEDTGAVSLSRDVSLGDVVGGRGCGGTAGGQEGGVTKFISGI